MNPSPADPPAPLDAAVEGAAADWIIKHDRGLTAAQQDAFLQWIAAAPAHRESFERHQRMWQRFNALSHWRPAHSAVPNPDLLARRRPHPLRWLAPTLLAAAAAVAVGLWWGPSFHPRMGTPLAFEAADYRQEVLSDGSVLDMNRGAHVVVQFSPNERRVLLVQGEAQFTVAKNAARPFVVRAGGMDVRAVGTAFQVKLAGASLEVLVTEGTVRVSQPVASTAVAAAEPVPPPVLAELSAGRHTVIALAPVVAPPLVRSASPQEIERLLEWKPRLLDFGSTPLAEVVDTFNRSNATRLVIADDTLRDLPIVASIRSDNVEGFVRLLEATMGVRAERPSPGEIVLRRAQ